MDYLKQLLTWVLVGVGVGLVIEGCSACLEYFEFLDYSPVKGYGTVFAASMVGAWISVAAFRREVALADLPQFIDWKHEPKMRLIFVGLVALAAALFVKTGLLPIVLGNLKLVEFTCKWEVAVVLGLVAGISEKKISVQLIQKAREAIPSSKK